MPWSEAVRGGGAKQGEALGFLRKLEGGGETERLDGKAGRLRRLNKRTKHTSQSVP